MTDYAARIRALAENQVEFIIVGGAAATVHGSAPKIGWCGADTLVCLHLGNPFRVLIQSGFQTQGSPPKSRRTTLGY